MNSKNQKPVKMMGNSILNFIVKCEESVIFLTGSFIALAMFGQVLLRYIFNSPLFGLEEISILIVSWFYFIGAANSVHNKSYIKADVLPLIVKNPKIIRIFNAISYILSIVATTLLFYYSFKYAVWSYHANVITPTFFIPKNVSFGSLVIGSLLMTLHFILLLYKEIRREI